MENREGATSLDGQRSADTILINECLNAGSCSRLRINTAILDKCNTSHVPNTLRFTIARVVVLTQTDRYRAGQMEREDEPGANLAKRNRKNGGLLVPIGTV